MHGVDVIHTVSLFGSPSLSERLVTEATPSSKKNGNYHTQQMEQKRTVVCVRPTVGVVREQWQVRLVTLGSLVRSLCIA